MTLKIDRNAWLIWRNKECRLHREDAPSIISPSGHIQYHYEDKFHRLDGPATVSPNGAKTYRIQGLYYTEDHYWEKINSNKI